MRFLSVCSGIEAASCAWHPLGWQAAAFAEIESFPCAVLAHHYPSVPNWGDLTKFKEWPDADVDVLVGGTPCQSFSVAGLRKGLDDPRGNLTLTYLAVAARYRPRWLVWENVPGVLSDATGAFGAFLGGLGQLGYGFAYRVLDAQHFGVPQRRRRVFVVGYLGDWRRAAAVLFERESLSGNPAPRREAREGVAARPSVGATFGCDGIGAYSSSSSSATLLKTGQDLGPGCEALIARQWPADVAPTLNAHFGDKQGLEDQHALAVGGGCSSVAKCLTGKQQRLDSETETFITAAAPNGGGFDVAHSREIAPSLTSNYGKQADSSDTALGPMLVTHSLQRQHGVTEDGTGRGVPIVTHSLRADGFDASEDGTGRGTPLVPVAIDCYNGAIDGEVTHSTRAGNGNALGGVPAVMSSAVRRLTPRECERLQGFPDDYTLIPRGKGMSKDGPRYKALGNSMAVPCMSWIGRRIQAVTGAVPLERAA